MRGRAPPRSKDAVVAPSLSRSLYSARELVVLPYVTFFSHGRVFSPRFLSFSVEFLVLWPFDPVARRQLLPSALLTENTGRSEEGPAWV